MAEQLFQITNTIALLAWIPLIIFPGQIFIRDTLCKRLIPGMLAIIYLATIAWRFTILGPPPGDVMTISGLRNAFVMTLYSRPLGLIILFSTWSLEP